MSKYLRLVCLSLLPWSVGLRAQGPPALDSVYYKFSEAYRLLDANMVQDLYQDDAYYIYPQIPLQKGHEHFMNGFIDMFRIAIVDTISLSIRFRIIDRKLIGDHAYDVGYYKLVRSNGRQSVGKFVTILRQQSNGQWKFVLDSYSSAPLDAFDKN